MALDLDSPDVLKAYAEVKAGKSLPIAAPAAAASHSLNLDSPEAMEAYKEVTGGDSGAPKTSTMRKAMRQTGALGFPYSDAMVQAVTENLLGIGRFVTKPFSKDTSEAVNNFSKDLQSKFEEDNSDSPDKLMAKEVFKIATLIALPGGKAYGTTKLAQLGSFLLANSGLGALYSGMFANSDQNIGSAMKIGSIAGPVSAALGTAVASTPKLLLKVVGAANPEKILNNLGKMVGKPFMGGDILESQTLQRMQMWMKNFITSGQAGKAKKITNDLQNKSSKILDDISGGINTETAESDLEHLFSSKASEIKKQKNQNFDDFEEISSGLGFDITPAAKAAQEKLKSVSDYINEYDFNSGDKGKLVNALDVIAKKGGTKTEYSSILDSSGNKIATGTKNLGEMKGDNAIKFAKFAAKDLDDLALEAPDSYSKAQLRSIASEIRGSINKSVEKFGTPEQKAAWKKANEYYANEYTKLTDPEVEPFILEKGDINPYKLFKKFAGRKIINDPFMMKKILNITGDEGKKLILADYFHGGAQDPVAMASKFSKLPKDSMDALLNSDQIKELNKLVEQVNLSTSALEKIFNAPTGHNVAPQQAQLMSFLSAGAAMMGAWDVSKGDHSGYKPLFLGLAALAGTPLLAKMLDSPMVLNAIAKSAMKPASEQAAKLGYAPVLAGINATQGGS